MTFSKEIHSRGYNTRLIRHNVTECLSKQGAMPSAKCQSVTWVSEEAQDKDSSALNRDINYECLKLAMQ